MNRSTFTLALPLLAAACAPDGTAIETGTAASLTAAKTCAAGTVRTQLHADFPDGTSLDIDDCLGAKSLSGIDGAEGDYWNGHFLDFRLASPDGATGVSFHSSIWDATKLRTGNDLSLPNQNDWMRLSLTSAHGTEESGPGTIHLDEWEIPSMDEADGRLSATITATLKAVDGGETTVRLKVTGIVLDSFMI